MDLFKRCKAELPSEISSRLRSSRHFTTGSQRTLYLFDVWDCNQTDVLDHQHFKYCLAYDGLSKVRNGFFHLWLNRIRIYREREAIIAALDRQLENAVPNGFTWHPHKDRAFNIGFDFNYPEDLSQFPDMLLPFYVSLISAIHPILMPLIDQFTTPLSDGERRQVVAARGRVPFTSPGVHDRKRIREYTRSIPPSWRPLILERSDHLCSNPTCRADLRLQGHHIDHIVPFSKGGTTTLENLQALCGPCNLTKGNRQ